MITPGTIDVPANTAPTTSDAGAPALVRVEGRLQVQNIAYGGALTYSLYFELYGTNGTRLADTRVDHTQRVFEGSQGYDGPSVFATAPKGSQLTVRMIVREAYGGVMPGTGTVLDSATVVIPADSGQIALLPASVNSDFVALRGSVVTS